jgi:hypothetical protein
MSAPLRARLRARKTGPLREAGVRLTPLLHPGFHRKKAEVPFRLVCQYLAQLAGLDGLDVILRHAERNRDVPN